jgi:hypothetical protein
MLQIVSNLRAGRQNTCDGGHITPEVSARRRRPLLRGIRTAAKDGFYYALGDSIHGPRSTLAVRSWGNPKQPGSSITN